MMSNDTIRMEILPAYSLTRISNQEGYVTFGRNPKISYYYYRKDHLGNNRELWRAHDKKNLLQVKQKQ